MGSAPVFTLYTELQNGLDIFLCFFILAVFLQVSHFRLPLTLTISTLRACQFFFNRKQTNVKQRQNFLAFPKTSVFWCHGECAK